MKRCGFPAAAPLRPGFDSQRRQKALVLILFFSGSLLSIRTLLYATLGGSSGGAFLFTLEYCQ